MKNLHLMVTVLPALWINHSGFAQSALTEMGQAVTGDDSGPSTCAFALLKSYKHLFVNISS